MDVVAKFPVLSLPNWCRMRSVYFNGFNGWLHVLLFRMTHNMTIYYKSSGTKIAVGLKDNSKA